METDGTARRAGSVAAIALGGMYVAITVLYVVAGAPPEDIAQRLAYLAEHSTAWWAIVALSVATDLLFAPVMWALYLLLKGFGRSAMLAGTGLVGLFVVLDLAVTWPNYAALITLGGDLATAADDTRTATILGAATYAGKVLSSGLFGVYAILVPAAGIAIISWIMLKPGFSRLTAYTGLATGVFGLVSVAGPVFVAAAGTFAILTSVLTTLWVVLVGFKLWRPPAATG
ncbi:MAG TPA: hypothetical protein VF062_29485 [Candidatus Limnocylindrales bacterium]